MNEHRSRRENLLQVLASHDDGYRSIIDAIKSSEISTVHFPDPGANSSLHEKFSGMMKEIYDNVEKEIRISIFEVLKKEIPGAVELINKLIDDEKSITSGSHDYIINKFCDESRNLISQTIQNPSTWICAFPSASCNEGSGALRRYHLGHLFFAELFSNINAEHGNVALLISPSTNYIVEPAFKKRIWSVSLTWMNYFGFRPDLFHIHTLVKNQKIDGVYEQMEKWLQEKEDRCHQSLSHKLKENIQDWYQDTSNVSNLYNIFDVESSGNDNEILSLAWMLLRNPPWYNRDWFCKAVKSHCPGPDSIHQRLFGTDKVVFIESSKNRCIWDAMAFCANRFGLTFPPRAYFLEVPSFVDNKPMRSKDKKGTIFVDTPLQDLKNPFYEKKMLKIVRMFYPDVENGAVSDKLGDLLKEGKEKFDTKDNVCDEYNVCGKKSACPHWEGN